MPTQLYRGKPLEEARREAEGLQQVLDARDGPAYAAAQARKAKREASSQGPYVRVKQELGPEEAALGADGGGSAAAAAAAAADAAATAAAAAVAEGEGDVPPTAPEPESSPGHDAQQPEGSSLPPPPAPARG